MRKPTFCICENKEQISFAVTAKLISDFFLLHRLYNPSTFQIQNFKPLAILCSCTAWFVSDRVENQNVGFLVTRLKYLSIDIWIIITREPLTFTLNCQSYKPMDNVIKTEIPFGIVKLNNSCMASSKHLQLPAYFGKHSALKMSDPMYSLLKIRNISNFHIWNYSKTDFTNLKSLRLPSSLQGLKEIPMQSFIHGIKSYKAINVKNDDEISWSLLVIILMASSVSVITLICMIRHRSKLHFVKQLVNGWLMSMTLEM